MSVIDALKALTPVTEWRRVGQPTASVSGAVGDSGYLFTEVGLHQNRLYQIVHYDKRESIRAVLAIDVVKGPSIIEGVGKFIDNQGRFDIAFFERMRQRFGPSLSVALNREGKVEFGLFDDNEP